MSSKVELSSYKEKGDSHDANFLKKSKTKDEVHEKRTMVNFVKIRIIAYLLYIILFVFFIYIIKPITFAIELVFLMNANTITKGDKAIIAGWLAIFVVPLIHFYRDGIKIVGIQEGWVTKFYTSILLLIEIYIGIPLPFLYTQTIYSIFLFNERGIELLIAPWLIFFPTNYVTSLFELIRNLITSLFFMSYSIIIITKYGPLEINTDRTYQFIIAVEVINILGYLVFLIGKIFSLIKEKDHKMKTERERERQRRDKMGSGEFKEEAKMN